MIQNMFRHVDFANMVIHHIVKSVTQKVQLI